MRHREKRAVICSNCEKQFPVVLEYDTEKTDGTRSREVYCPHCDTLLTIDLPGGPTPNTTAFRGLKKGEK